MSKITSLAIYCKNMTVKDVYDCMSQDKKDLLHRIIGCALRHNLIVFSDKEKEILNKLTDVECEIFEYLIAMVLEEDEKNE